MARLAVFVISLLTVAYAAIYCLFDHRLKGPGAFFREFGEGVAPWLVIVAAVWAVRRAGRRPSRRTG